MSHNKKENVSPIGDSQKSRVENINADGASEGEGMLSEADGENADGHGDQHNTDKQENLNESNLYRETKLLRDTLDLMWNQTLEQRNLCDQLGRENDYLQEYISNLMTSSNVLDNDKETVKEISKMYHSKSDENIGDHHSITYSKGQIKPVNHLDAVKLRSVNLKNRSSQFQHIGHEETVDLVKFLRKPEKLPTTRRIWHKLQLKHIELEPLEDIETQFIPESPSLEHTLAATSNAASALLNESDGNTLDLSNLSKFVDRSFDCPPFFHAYDYESRLESTDYGSILYRAVEDQIKGEQPVFQREMEYQELRKFVRKVDYFMYYIFGIDNTGYFELQRDRTMFQGSTQIAYTSPLKILEESEGSDHSGEENVNLSIIYEQDYDREDASVRSSNMRVGEP